MSARDWEALAGEIAEISGITNLNPATCSPLPWPVHKALGRWREAVAREPVLTLWWSQLTSIEEGRRQLAAYVNADPADLLLMPNTSHGINTVLQSLPLNAGDEILTSPQEYHHFDAALETLSARSGIKVTRVEFPPLERPDEWTPEALVEAFSRKISGRTKALFFSHLTSATGLVMPATQLTRLARDHGLWSVADGAHTPGAMDLDLEAVGADFYAGNGHKWLMGPVGTGFLHVRQDQRRWLHPLVLTSFTPDAPDTAEGTSGFQKAFEYMGTTDRCAQAVLPEVFAFRETIGEAAIQRRMRELSRFARQAMEELGYRSVSPTHGDLESHMVAFEIPGIDTVKAWEWFRDKAGFELAFPTLPPNHQFLRLAPAWFNQRSDFERLARILDGFDWSQFQ